MNFNPSLPTHTHCCISFYFLHPVPLNYSPLINLPALASPLNLPVFLCRSLLYLQLISVSSIPKNFFLALLLSQSSVFLYISFPDMVTKKLVSIYCLSFLATTNSSEPRFPFQLLGCNLFHKVINDLTVTESSGISLSPLEL